SCSTRKNDDSCDRATWESVCRIVAGAERTSEMRNAPNRVLVSRAVKVDGSTGSETTGVKVLHAISFQNSSLRRGSIPSVANVSSTLMLVAANPGSHGHSVSLHARRGNAHGSRQIPNGSPLCAVLRDLLMRPVNDVRANRLDLRRRQCLGERDHA